MVSSKQNRWIDQKSIRGIFLNSSYFSIIDQQNEQNKWITYPNEKDNPIWKIEGNACN